MVSLQRAIGRELERPPTVDTDLCLESMAVALRAHLMRRCSSTALTRAGQEDAAVARVNVLLRDRLSEKLDLSSIAAEVGLTRAGLMRAFLRATGTTIHALSMGERLQQAKTALEGRHDARERNRETGWLCEPCSPDDAIRPQIRDDPIGLSLLPEQLISDKADAAFCKPAHAVAISRNPPSVQSF